MPSPHHLFPEKASRTLVAVLANRMREKTLSNATFQGVILCKAGSLRGHVGSRSQTQHLLYAIKPITSCGVVQFAVRQTLYKSRAKWHIRNQGHAPGSEAQSGPQGPPGPGGRLAHGSAACHLRAARAPSARCDDAAWGPSCVQTSTQRPSCVGITPGSPICWSRKMATAPHRPHPAACAGRPSRGPRSRACGPRSAVHYCECSSARGEKY